MCWGSKWGVAVTERYIIDLRKGKKFDIRKVVDISIANEGVKISDGEKSAILNYGNGYLATWLNEYCVRYGNNAKVWKEQMFWTPKPVNQIIVEENEGEKLLNFLKDRRQTFLENRNANITSQSILENIIDESPDNLWVFFPGKKHYEKCKENALNSYAIYAKDEEIVFIYNDSLIFVGKQGFLVTMEYVYAYSLRSIGKYPENRIPLYEIKDFFYNEKQSIYMQARLWNGEAIELAGAGDDLLTIAECLNDMLYEMEGE